MSTCTRIKTAKRRCREGSFTLIETVIALAIVTFLIIEVSAVQGNSIVFADYGRNVTQATWLARQVLAQVEYYWRIKPFKELMTKVPEAKFEDFPEYSYSLEIKEWKFPFVKLLQSALGGGANKEEGEGKDAKSAGSMDGKGLDSGISQMIEGVVKQIFGDEPVFLTAHVDVSWAEGANRNSTGLTYLMTNQAKLDEAIATMKGTYDKLVKPAARRTDNKPTKPGNAPGDQPAPSPTPDPNAGG